jgi:hypothetical protein
MALARVNRFQGSFAASPCRRVQIPVGDFEGIALALVFGCRSLRKLADDRQRVSLFVAGLDNHEHPHEQNQKV